MRKDPRGGRLREVAPVDEVKGDSHQIWRWSLSKRGKPTIVSSVFHGAESCIRAPIAWPRP